MAFLDVRVTLGGIGRDGRGVKPKNSASFKKVHRRRSARTLSHYPSAQISDRFRGLEFPLYLRKGRKGNASNRTGVRLGSDDSGVFFFCGTKPSVVIR